MIKIIDIDSLFDAYISDYVYKNIGKVKPEEIENKIPQLYLEFGGQSLAELDGKTPETYYKSFLVSNLLECLKGHLEQGVPVSDFLCEAITGDKDNQEELIGALTKAQDEEFILYLMNMLIEIASDKCFDKFLELILWDYSEPVKELATEDLKENANAVKGEILAQFDDCEQKVKEYLTEILSGVKGDERVFNVLVEQFKLNKDKLPIYASYLAKYGDERAIPVLTEEIENEKISYADFEELRFAIEMLGGQYTKERDFSKDKTFRKIKGEKKQSK